VHNEPHLQSRMRVGCAEPSMADAQTPTIPDQVRDDWGWATSTA
jgi:hypothetical protein